MRRRSLLAALLALSTIASCASEAGESPLAAGAAGPDAGDWDEAAPEAVGLDPAVLDQMAAEAAATGSTCMLVVRHGAIAGEWYWNGGAPHRAQEVFSVTKSFTSTLVGMAVADGDVGLDDRAARWIPDWVGTPSEAVTVRNLLSNDSGRFWSFVGDYQRMLESDDRTAYAIGLGQAAPPGTVWVYNNAAIQTLEQVLEQATGRPVPDFADDRLLGPLGMTDSSLTTDPAGNGLTFMGLQSTCRDLGRFGWLILRAGRWGDRQLVPRGWVEEATGAPSQELNAAYGLLWWLNRPGPQAAPGAPTELDGATAGGNQQLVPGAPEDLVWALGLGGQVVQVHRASDTVFVRLGGPTLTSPYQLAMAARLVTEGITGR